MTMGHGFEVAAPGTPVDGDGWRIPPAGLRITFAVGKPPETGGFAVRYQGVLLASGVADLYPPGPAPAPGVVVLAARHLDPGEGRIRAGHRVDLDDLAAIRTVLWFAAGIGEDGASRRGPVRDGVTVPNALAGPPVTAGPCLCGRQLYTVVTQVLSHQDGTAPCSAPLPPMIDAASLAELDDDETARALAYRVPGSRPRTGGRVAATSHGPVAGTSELPEWERQVLAEEAAEAAGFASGGNGGGQGAAGGGAASSSGANAAGGQ